MNSIVDIYLIGRCFVLQRGIRLAFGWVNSGNNLVRSAFASETTSSNDKQWPLSGQNFFFCLIKDINWKQFQFNELSINKIEVHIFNYSYHWQRPELRISCPKYRRLLKMLSASRKWESLYIVQCIVLRAVTKYGKIEFNSFSYFPS